MKNEFIKGKQYKTQFGLLTFNGYFEFNPDRHYFQCDMCHKWRSNLYEFENEAIGFYHFGKECINKLEIRE